MMMNVAKIAPGHWLVDGRQVFTKTDATEAEALAVLTEAAAPQTAAQIADAARSAALAALLDDLEATALRLTGQVPLSERLSWTLKAGAARAVLEGLASPAETAMLATEAAQTGEDISGLAERIVANADAYAVAAAALAGIRRKYTARIDAAADPETVAVALAGARGAMNALS